MSAEVTLAAWEAGVLRGPLDRGLVLLWAGGDSEGAADQPLPDRDRRLLAIRQACFGQSLDCVATCPACGARVELSMDATALAGRMPPPEADTVQIGGRLVALRSLTSRDLAAAEGVAPEALAGFLRRRLVPGTDDLTAGEVAEIEALIEARAEAAETRLALTCPDCETTWYEALDIATYLWAEVEAAAFRTMAEVAELARAFGWSEPEVLALPPERKAVYLRLARERI